MIDIVYYCKDIRGLFQEMDEDYDPGDCRLFMGSSKSSYSIIKKQHSKLQEEKNISGFQYLMIKFP